MKKIVVSLLFVIAFNYGGYAQLNQYKYVIVPTKLADFKHENQFQTSTLIKHLLTKEGFNAVYENALPDDLNANRCTGVKIELLDNSSLFTTKAKLQLVDCRGTVVFMTQDGRSKTKDFKQAYKEVITDAFLSIRGLNYTYRAKEANNEPETVTVSFKNDVKSLGKEAGGQDVNTQKTTVPLTKIKKAEKLSEDMEGAKSLLFAQPIENGYQLVDTTPKVVYVLKSTAAPDVFLVNKDGKSGVVFKNEGKWYIEMDVKDSEAKELHIKF